jgi:hypothetical protein
MSFDQKGIKWNIYEQNVANSYSVSICLSPLTYQSKKLIFFSFFWKVICQGLNYLLYSRTKWEGKIEQNLSTIGFLIEGVSKGVFFPKILELWVRGVICDLNVAPAVKKNPESTKLFKRLNILLHST